MPVNRSKNGVHDISIEKKSIWQSKEKQNNKTKTMTNGWLMINMGNEAEFNQMITSFDLFATTTASVL